MILRNEREPLKEILSGKSVLVTRPQKQARELMKLIEERGAIPVLFPVIETIWPDDLEPLDQALQDLKQYDWVLFTSVNGVDFFFQRLEQVYRTEVECRTDWDSLLSSLFREIKVAAIGPKTAQALQEKGVNVTSLPTRFKQEDLVHEVTHKTDSSGEAGLRILFPRAEQARKHLGEELRNLGMIVDEVVTYQTIKVDQGKEAVYHHLRNKELDIITFTSSSAVKNFTQIFEYIEWEDDLKSVIIACIGPVTAHTAREHGLKVDVEATIYTIEGLLDQLEDYFLRKKV
jgi:uroporphyrinogen III methyltransferase/synthase